MRILKIGITGSAGSGKSLVCNMMGKMGLVTLDCDQIARQVVEPGQRAYDAVVKLFGETVIQSDRTLNRAEMRKMIIEIPVLRQQLESLLHPLIIEELFSQIEQADYPDEPACAAEVPLLFELKMEKRFDAVVTVVSKDQTLVDRIALRDGVDEMSAAKILALQMPQAEKQKRSDYVVENSGTRKELFGTVSNLYAAIKKELLTGGE